MRLGAVGDVVRTLPAVSSLRRAYAGAHVAWLVEPRAASAVEGQPWLDEVLVFPRPEIVDELASGAPLAAWQRFAHFARELRARRFELAVDFHSLARSALLIRLAGVRLRVGYARPFGRELSPLLATHRARISPARVSRFERNQALVRFLAVEAPPEPAPFHLMPAARARAEAALGPGARPAILHPGSSERTPHKRWSPRAYGQLARALRDAEALPSLVTWGPARGDREAALAVVEASGGAAGLAPETPGLGDLAALLAAGRLYVGGDTGPMHLASLVGTPVVQLLGPTDRIENAPWSETPSRTVSAAAGVRDPMAIEPAAVLAAVRELLAATSAPTRVAAGRH